MPRSYSFFRSLLSCWPNANHPRFASSIPVERPPLTACAVGVMDYALSSTEQNDIVFLGDSICRSGVEPRQFESLTELRAYNLGMLFGGLGPDVLTDVAAAYLMKHRRPRMIVLCTSPVCFEKDVPDVYVQLRDRFLRCYAWDLSDLRTFHGSQRCLIGVGYLIRQGVMIGWDRVSCSFIGHRHDVLDDPLDGDAATTFRTLEDARTLRRVLRHVRQRSSRKPRPTRRSCAHPRRLGPRCAPPGDNLR